MMGLVTGGISMETAPFGESSSQGWGVRAARKASKNIWRQRLSIGAAWA